MKTPSFARVIGDAIEPLGFEKVARDRWDRRVGDYVDTVILTVSRDLTEITVELWVVDMAVHDYIQEASPPRDKAVVPAIDTRPGHLIDGLARWWTRADPAARGEMAQVILDHAIPFFDRMHSLEAMRDYLEKHGARRRNSILTRMHLAVILHRLGKTEEACSILFPPGRLMPEKWHEKIAGLRNRICGPDAPIASYPPPPASA